MGYWPDQNNTGPSYPRSLYQATGTIGILSMMGSLCIVLTFGAVSQLRRHPYVLILFLAICDLCFSLKFVLASGVRLQRNALRPSTSQWWCVLEALDSQLWGTGSVGWLAAICVNLLLTLRNPFGNVAPLQKYMHVLVWGYSGATTVLLATAARQALGPAGDGTCWVARAPDAFSAHWFELTFFAPLLLAFVTACAAVLISQQRTSLDARESSLAVAEPSVAPSGSLPLLSPASQAAAGLSRDDPEARALRYRMRLLALGFLVLWAGPVAHKVVQFVRAGSAPDPLWLVYWDALSQAAYGGVNALVWLTSPQLWRPFRRRVVRAASRRVRALMCAACCGCCCCSWCQRHAADAANDHDDEADLDGDEERGLLASSARGGEGEADVIAADALLRRNILTLLLLGIRQALRDAAVASSPSDDVVERKYSSRPGRASRAIGEEGLSGRSSVSEGSVGSGGYGTGGRLREWVASGAALASQGVLGLGYYRFKDYGAELFAAVRAFDHWDPAAYEAELAPARFLSGRADLSEGRSGAFFCFSPSRRLLIKTISRHEAKVLRAMLPHLVQYLRAHPRSRIARIYGLHALHLANDLHLHVLVMQNALGGAPVHERFDLKGSWIARSSAAHRRAPGRAVGKDLDLRRPLKIPREVATDLFDQLCADAAFLASRGAMDYSLLLGIRHLRPVAAAMAGSYASAPVPTPAPPLAPAAASSAPAPAPPAVPLEPIMERVAAAASPSAAPAPAAEARSFLEQPVASEDGSEEYYMAVIDILQPYDCGKRTERCCKVYFLWADPEGLSVQPVERYCRRFQQRIPAMLAPTYRP